ncbi:MAG: LLM class flavin-dependent oxidoreductase, partial [Gemmatimonadetes bacterium]|nr:LLM class flavin-dependent oxidoreductase [Gemmatimonadota bacterium]
MDEVSISPVPIQAPNPPIWLGAQSEPAVRRAARLADAW